jgi:hypothetical protein
VYVIFIHDKKRGTFLDFAGPHNSEMYRFFMTNFEWSQACECKILSHVLVTVEMVWIGE